MTDTEYQQKLKQCKTNKERNLLNDKFLKSKCKSNKHKKHSEYFKTNVLVIIDLILSVIGIIISLFK